MVRFFAALRHIAGIALFALAVGIAPAGAAENAGVVESVAAVTADATTTDAAKHDVAKTDVKITDVAKTQTAMAAYAAGARLIARRAAVAASQQDRRAAFTRTRLGCSGVWCGRHYVLMLGVGY